MSEAAEDGETSDVDVLRSACSESRAVLDEQLQKLADIGDKAIWTVRSSVLVLGLVVSAASLGDAAMLRTLHPAVVVAASAGVASLLAACIYGLGTYFGMDRVSGIGTEHRTLVATESVSEREWWLTLLAGYDDWIADVERTTDRYGTHLFRAQAVFVVGVFLFVLAGALSVVALYPAT
jgi:hypothetical protein